MISEPLESSFAMPAAIDRAGVDDAQEILALQKLAYESEAELYDNWNIPPLKQTLPEIMSEFGELVFLRARIDDRIVGSVRASVKGDVCEIGRLIVHPAFQRRGIGRSLMKAIESRFPNAARFRVFTGERSEANINHYRSHGYEIAERKPSPEGVTIVFLERKVVSPGGK